MVKGFTKNGKFRPTVKRAPFDPERWIAPLHKMGYCAKCGIDFKDPPNKKNGTSNICYSCDRKLKSKK